MCLGKIRVAAGCLRRKSFLVCHGGLDFLLRCCGRLDQRFLYGSGWKSVVHRDDIQLLESWSQETRQSQEAGTTEVRLRRFDGSHLWFLVFANSLWDESGNIIGWYGTNIDIEDRKRSEAMLRARELSWRQIVDNIPGFVYRLSPTGEPEFINRQTLEYFGKTNEELKDWSRLGIVHPDDLSRAIDALRQALEAGQSYEIEHRCRRADGVYRWFQVRGYPEQNSEGNIAAWYFLITDIDDLKRAEERLRQGEADLRTITDTIRQPIVVLAPDGSMLYANRVALDNSGLTIDELKKGGFLARACHPDDVERVLDERNRGLSKAIPFDSEARILFKDGEYRWQLLQYNPLKDESAQVTRWYATATDIDDRKRKEERLRNENVKLAQERVYLEERIRSEMGYEQIIGNSPALKHVLELVETVSQSDSTVLLLGETGTGKELIARAVHERSRRKAKTFVKLNCAAIPTGLLESELFGHEKGAFTGAIIQKVGRMELADQGTLFWIK
jgi:formate hydrogenlyase transcriptional activator